MIRSKDIKRIYETYTNPPASTPTPKPEPSKQEATPGTSKTPSKDTKTIEDLKKAGYKVEEWDMPGVGPQIQITFAQDPGPSRGATIYVPSGTQMSNIQQAIAAKRKLFNQH